MEIEIEIKNSGPALSKELFGRPAHMCIGTEVKGPDGIALKLVSIRESRSIDYPSIFNMILTIGKDVGVGIISAWLYDKLKRRATKIYIDRVEIEITENNIKRILVEKIGENQ
ncbi:MAG TPA: hypothetical protein VIH42_01945 [Thermoguttaceae bacterium]